MRSFLIFCAALACALTSAAAEPASADFDPAAIYMLRNKATGTSPLLGLPDLGYGDDAVVGMGDGIGGVKFRKGVGENAWQLLSPLGGVLVCNWERNDYKFRVFENAAGPNLGFELDITSRDDGYFTMSYETIESAGPMTNYVVADGAWLITVQSLPDNGSGLWEAVPLPAGAILNVPRPPYDAIYDEDMRAKMANCAFPSEYEGEARQACKIDLTDEKGFACAYEVEALELAFTRELKAGWQGLCAPIALDYDEWHAFGQIYRLAGAEETVGEDGSVSISLSLAEAATFEPNTPYLIYVRPESAGVMAVTRTKPYFYGTADVSPSAPLQPDLVQTAGATCKLECVYDFTRVPYSAPDSGEKSYALKGGVFMRPDADGAMLRPYRVMLTITTAAGRAPARISLKTGGEPAAIEAIDSDPPRPAQRYDLSGRPAAPTARGLLLTPAGKTLVR